MRTIKVVPGKALNELINNGASIEEIAKHVRYEAEHSGLSGEVAIMIELPDVPEEPRASTFVEVA